MKQLISKLMLMVIIFQVIVPVAIAEDRRTQIDTSMSDFGESTSFRKRDYQQFQQQSENVMQEQKMMNKGTMMNEPSMASLSYQVHILGEIKKPGTLRITASDRLSEVLQRAGGVSDNGSQRNIEIRRQGEGTKRVDLIAFQLFGNLNDNPYLLDNDVVFVPLKIGAIQVEGAVKRPKEYELKNERTLLDAIQLAGGFSVGIAKESPIRVVRFIDDKKNVIEVASNDTEMGAFDIQNGDIIFIPHMITEKNEFDYDVPKLPGDNIFYPSYEDRVFILGGVTQPGAYPFNPYYRLSQYLSLAGGTTLMHNSKMSLISPDGKSRKLSQKDRDTIIINPGDTIKVGERRIAPEGWVSIALGIMSFGLSASATILALKK